MDKEMGLLEHLDELRRRLLYILGTVGVLMVFCFIFGVRYVSVEFEAEEEYACVARL